MDPSRQRSFKAIRVLGATVASGPLVIPSFSSEALPKVPVGEIVDRTRDFIAGPILISAYDVAHHGVVVERLPASLLVVDSGGYETLELELGIDKQRTDRAYCPHLEWSPEAYGRTLDRISASCPVLAVSYDRTELSFADQIDAAIEARNPRFGSSFLIKPTASEPLRIEALAGHADRLDAFDVVGVTEKEIGSTFMERLVFIARLRELLDERGVHKPVHVFGGLDPFMTPLYFLAGADLVDGLTWLRMAFARGGARYLPSQAAYSNPRSALDEEQWRIRRRNFGRAVDIQTGVRRFMLGGDYMQLAEDPWLCSAIKSA